MSVVIGADLAGLKLKEIVKSFPEEEGHQVVDVPTEGQDFIDVTLSVAKRGTKKREILVLSLMLMVQDLAWLQRKSKVWLQQKFQMNAQLI